MKYLKKYNESLTSKFDDVKDCVIYLSDNYHTEIKQSTEKIVPDIVIVHINSNESVDELYDNLYRTEERLKDNNKKIYKIWLCFYKKDRHEKWDEYKTIKDIAFKIRSYGYSYDQSIIELQITDIK